VVLQAAQRINDKCFVPHGNPKKAVANLKVKSESLGLPLRDPAAPAPLANLLALAREEKRLTTGGERRLQAQADALYGNARGGGGDEGQAGPSCKKQRVA
jgi:hypothetical protein